MSGKRLGSFRQGDRSEYLALFGLSRVAFVWSVPRQEDFGVADFICVLGAERDRRVYPGSAFYVQVKSDDAPIAFDRDAVRWISHYMDHPLLVCVVDKATGTLTLFSFARVWKVLFQKPDVRRLTVPLRGEEPNPNPTMVEDADGVSADLHLGPAVLRQTITDLERDTSLAASILEQWVTIDAANIARRRIGRIAARTFASWQTNVVPEPACWTDYHYGPGYSIAEAALAPILTALAHNYRHDGNRTKLEPLARFLAVIKEHLDPHGLDFAEGRNRVE